MAPRSLCRAERVRRGSRAIATRPTPGEKTSQGVVCVRVGQGNGPIRGAEWAADGGDGQTAVIGREVAVGETDEDIKGSMPWGPDSECVKERAQRGGVWGRRVSPLE